MTTYTVTQTVQSGGYEPKEIRYYSGEDHVQAIAALVMAGTTGDDAANIPASLRYRVLSVRMDITHS